MPDDQITPFSNGSQYVDWLASNCDRCTKSYDEVAEVYRCPIQEAIGLASIDDGSVSAEIAGRMGITPETEHRYVWKCSEVEWTSDWVAEVARRATLRYKIGYFLWKARRRVHKSIRDAYDKVRCKILWPIAERKGMDDPDGCWAAWCSWAMGYGERPGPNSGASCKIKPGDECRSCWCGKFTAEESTTEAAHAPI